MGSDDNVTRIVIGGKRSTFQLCIDKWFQWLYTEILDLSLDDVDDDIEFSKQNKTKKEFLIFLVHDEGLML